MNQLAKLVAAIRDCDGGGACIPKLLRCPDQATFPQVAAANSIDDTRRRQRVLRQASRVS